MHRTNQINKDGGNLKDPEHFAMARDIASKWEIQQRFTELAVTMAVSVGFKGSSDTQVTGN